MNGQKPTNFFMMVQNGYSLRNTFSIIDTEAAETVGMKLNPEGIEICFTNKMGCGLHKVQFRRDEIDYQYDIRSDDGTLLPEYVIGFDTKRMAQSLSSVNRKDAVQIYWMKGQQVISISPIKNGPKTPNSAGAMFVGIVPHEYEQRGNGADKNFGSQPDFRIQSKEFADFCKQSRECKYMEFFESNGAINIQGVLPNMAVSGLKKYPKSSANILISQPAQIDESLDVLIRGLDDKLKIAENTGKLVSLSIAPTMSSVKINNAIVKALAKIHNISTPDTMLKFYFSAGGSLKIASPISNYGTYCIYLKNQ